MRNSIESEISEYKRDMDFIEELNRRTKKHLEESLKLESEARELRAILEGRLPDKSMSASVNKVAKKELLSQPEASQYLKVSNSYLTYDRRTRRRIPFIKIGKLVRYDKDDLDRFIEQQSTVKHRK